MLLTYFQQFMNYEHSVILIFDLLKFIYPKICLREMISRIFLSKFLQIHKISVSGHFIHFIFKICQTTADISMIKQFHEFLSLIFGGILQIRSQCVVVRQRSP